MINGKRVLGLIPARGGSKRLPRKNVLDFAGKPMIAWTIEAARQAASIDRVVLSSDDAEIIAVAKQFGCDVPFTRPDEFASDSASSASVVCHALDTLEEKYDILVLLQPTSPLRTAGDIEGTLALAAEAPGGSAVSVAPLPKPKSYFGTQEGGVFAFRDFYGDSDPVVLNGAVYAIDIARFRASEAFILADTRAYLMPADRSVDVDDLLDFRIAEATMRLRQES